MPVGSNRRATIAIALLLVLVSGCAPRTKYAAPAVETPASYKADVWGRIRGTLAVSRLSAQATAADLEAARLSIHAELAVDYFSMRGIDGERQLLASAVGAFEKALELTQNRFLGGIASQADVPLAEAQLERTRAQAVDIEAERAPPEHAMSALGGQPPAPLAAPAMPPAT